MTDVKIDRFEVTTGGQVATEVLVGPGLIDTFALPARTSRQKVVVLTQPGEPRRLSDRIRELVDVETEIIELPDRDAAKQWRVVADIHEELARLAIGRHDTLVGVGGGAITDVGGFVAATWLRGIEAVYVPTTLLGAVDAAIGGKTGINLAGKNLVGAFAHPAQVTVDTQVLDALPVEIKREGWAEAIKTGFIADAELVQLFVSNPSAPPTHELVTRSIAVKAAVVSEDFTEQGRRAILNFGHTIGHGVEIAQGISHGAAVAIGMVAAAEVSHRRYGWDYPMIEVLGSLGLPTAAQTDRQTVEDLVWLDKKRDAKGLRMVLLSDVGVPHVDHVGPADVSAGLAAIGLP